MGGGPTEASVRHIVHVRPASEDNCAVSALAGQVFDGVHAKVAGAPPIRQKLFHTAMAVAR